MIDFVGKRKIFFTISVVMIALVVVASFVLGVNLDIQFKGGSIASYSYTGSVDADAFAKVVKDYTGGEASVQDQVNSVTGEHTLSVALSSDEGLSTEAQTELSEKLAEAFPENSIVMTDVNNVDPVMGQEFFKKCLVAIVFASALMILYIGVRFRKIGGWSAGCVSVIALIHDILIAYGAFVVLGYPINDNFIAVVLTILGYSINDTIVIYDRIRENERLYGSKKELGEIVNLSINQSKGRTINTTVSTVIALLSICIVASVMNVTSILTFAIPMTVGVVSGLYSSVCLSGPLWVFWKEKQAAKKAAEQ